VATRYPESERLSAIRAWTRADESWQWKRFFTLHDRAVEGKTDEDGGTFLPRDTIAKRVGFGPKVVSDTFDILSAESIVHRENRPIRDGRH
jgi:hypothetical protein